MKFVAVGNVAIDKGLRDRSISGGPVLYSSLLAAKLGLESVAVTTFGEDFLSAMPDWHAVSVRSRPCPETTTFSLAYTPEGIRELVLEKEGGTIEADMLLSEVRDADVIFLCPLAHEISPELVLFAAKENSGKGMIAVAPQGWLRSWEQGGGRVSVHPWKEAKDILQHADILVISEEDVQGNQKLIEKYRASTKGIMVVTQGPRGATAYRGKEVFSQPAYPAAVVDPTGAGDIFAAALAISWRETFSVEEALRFANAAASLAIEAIGASGVPTRADIQRRMLI